MGKHNKPTRTLIKSFLSNIYEIQHRQSFWIDLFFIQNVENAKISQCYAHGTIDGKIDYGLVSRRKPYYLKR